MDKQQEDMWVQTGAQLAAARAMLKALKRLCEMGSFVGTKDLETARTAIAQAEEAGITTGEK